MNPRAAFAIRAACLLLVMAGFTPAGAQTARNHGIGRSDSLPYAGSIEDALRASAAGATIPMSPYSVIAGRDSHRYSGTIVGADPASVPKVTTTINVLIVPLIV